MSVGVLLLPAGELEPVRLEFVAPALRSCNACRSATSMLTASCRHSTLAIDDRRLVLVYAERVSARGLVGVRMVEGVDRIASCDLDVKARARYQVADGKLHSIDLGAPKKEDFGRAAQPLGQLSSWRIPLCDFALHENPFRETESMVGS